MTSRNAPEGIAQACGLVPARVPAGRRQRHIALPQGVVPPRLAAGFRQVVTIVLGTLLLAMVLLTGSLLLLPAHSLVARADSLPAAPLPPAHDPLAGLFFPLAPGGQADAGQAFEAPQLSSDVRITVSGMVARVNLRQRFINPSDRWQEGIYVFPLPEKSAVDRLVMTVGERKITGRILEKIEAEQVYQKAAAQGQRASLLSSERPNVFVTSVANIGPGEEIVVEIEYQDAAVYRDGSFSLRFPMVVAPRYTPPVSVARMVAADPDRPTDPQPQVTAMPDAPGRDLFGQVRQPDGDARNAMTLTMTLDPGLPLADFKSLYHAVDIDALDERRRILTLTEGSVPANRDFVAEWRLKNSGTPGAALFIEEAGGETYSLTMLVPPAAGSSGERPAAVLPRDVTFIMDTSGSMHGDSMEQAKAALSLAISRLQPGDRFNVIRFNDETYSLFAQAEDVTADSLRRAQAYVNALKAEGGTHIHPALLRALTPSDPPAGDPEGRLRQVVFLTDGAVSNEDALFQTIADRLGNTRLFTIGIGSAPNSYFMRKAAEVGRGSYTYIGRPEEVAERMSGLLRKLERPALTDVVLGWPAAAGKRIESYPSVVPDLYHGEPVFVLSRLGDVPREQLDGRVLVTGKRGPESWQRSLALAEPSGARGIAALWARAKFEEITDGLYLGRDPVAVRLEALQVALDHALVTRYTSLVAVDDTPARPQDEPLETSDVPRDLPEGWDYEKVFGDGTAEPAPPADQREADVMPLRQLPAPIAHQAAARGQAISLPQTATDMPVKSLVGGVLLLCGLLLLSRAWLGGGRHDQRG